MEVFAIANTEPLNIFWKTLHLGSLIELWIPLCVFVFYFDRKDILRLDKLIAEEDM